MSNNSGKKKIMSNHVENCVWMLTKRMKKNAILIKRCEDWQFYVEKIKEWNWLAFCNIYQFVSDYCLILWYWDVSCYLFSASSPKRINSTVASERVWYRCSNRKSSICSNSSVSTDTVYRGLLVAILNLISLRRIWYVSALWYSLRNILRKLFSFFFLGVLPI